MIIIRQKEFAFRDYEGLDEISKANLKEERSELAKELNRSRHLYNKRLNEGLENLKTATGIIEKTGPQNIVNQGSSFYNNVGATHGEEVRRMVSQRMTGKDAKVIKGDIYRDRRSRYNNALRDIKEDSNWFREGELKRTKAREEAVKSEEAARRAAESKASIASHEAKAAELKAKKKTGEMLKKGGKGALIVGGTVAAGIGAKKLYDKKKAKPEQKEIG